MSTTTTTPTPAAVTLGAVTWNTWQNLTLYQCGCLTNTTTTPVSLLRWCGQPYCLRLFAAGVAYTEAQYNWQLAHGGTPTLVAYFMTQNVTPLPQTLPPPTTTVSIASGSTSSTTTSGTSSSGTTSTT